MAGRRRRARRGRRGEEAPTRGRRHELVRGRGRERGRRETRHVDDDGPRRLRTLRERHARGARRAQARLHAREEDAPFVHLRRDGAREGREGGEERLRRRGLRRLVARQDRELRGTEERVPRRPGDRLRGSATARRPRPGRPASRARSRTRPSSTARSTTRVRRVPRSVRPRSRRPSPATSSRARSCPPRAARSAAGATSRSSPSRRTAGRASRARTTRRAARRSSARS